jgi:hypothetical protein
MPVRVSHRNSTIWNCLSDDESERRLSLWRPMSTSSKEVKPVPAIEACEGLAMAIESHHGNSKVTSYNLIERSKMPSNCNGPEAAVG